MATRQQRMDAFIHEGEKTRLGQETLSFKARYGEPLIEKLWFRRLGASSCSYE